MPVCLTLYHQLCQACDLGLGSESLIRAYYVQYLWWSGVKIRGRWGWGKAGAPRKMVVNTLANKHLSSKSFIVYV